MQKPGTVFTILLNWENSPLTIRCLAALLDSTYQNQSIVICDNGSRDQSVAILREWLSAHAADGTPAQPPTAPNVDFSATIAGAAGPINATILNNGANLGFSAGTNTGLSFAICAGAEFAWVLNNDTVPAPDALAQLVGAAQSAPRAGAIGSVILDYDPPHRPQVWGGGRLNLWTGTGHNIKTRPRNGRLDFVTGASMLLRTQALREIGLFDRRFFLYWDDADLCLRLTRAAWGLAVAEGSCVFHEQSATNGKRGPGLDRNYSASAVRMYRKHAPAPLIPALIGTGGRLLKRVLRLRWPEFRATLASAIRAWGDPQRLR